MNKFKVTKEEVQIFENIRQSGVINMYDVTTGLKISGGILNRDSWEYIMDNYCELIDHYEIERK